MKTFLSARRKKKRTSAKRRLGFENLESRELMATVGLPDYVAVFVNAPDTVVVGEPPVAFKFAIRNGGPGDGRTFIENRFEILNSSNVVVKRFALLKTPQVRSGDTLPGSAPYPVSDLAPGQYQVRFTVDADNANRELSESNNTTVARFRVVPAGSSNPPSSGGLLDSAFGKNGQVSLSAPGIPLGSNTALNAVAVQPDGLSVVVGFTENGSNPDMLVMRINRDGSLDRTFGSNGATTINFGLVNLYDQANAVALQSDGKIVVAGISAVVSGGGSFAIVRLLANGQLDASFGSGGRVRVDFDLGGDLQDGATSIAIQSNGRILVGGTAMFSSSGDTDFAVARLNADGTLDSSFSGDGKATVAFDRGGNKADHVSGIAVDSSGRILLAGSAEAGTGGNHDFAIARLTSIGSLDSTFGTGGKVTVPFDRGGGKDDRATSIAIQPDGKIVLGGYSQIDSVGLGNFDFAAVRLLTNGQLDATFDGDGKAIIPFDIGGDRNDKARAIAVDSRGRIIIAGTVSYSSRDYDFAVARLKSNGSLDTSFNGNGKFRFGFDRGGDLDDAAFGLALTSDRIVLVGDAQVSPSVYDAAIARLMNV